MIKKISAFIFITLVTNLFIFFFALYIFMAFSNMVNTPFNDFDEAHRAEQAKRMKEYSSFLVPLTGSPQDRVPDLKIPFRENPNLFLYYHPERPPLVYWLMIVSTSIFGQNEWAYRLPSFLMGSLTIVLCIITLVKLTKKINLIAFSVGLLTLITSADLWLSSQSSQLDTSLTFFLSLSILALIFYCQKKSNFMLAISALSFALAVLSKGQPAIIFIIPLLTTLIIKKINLRELIKFGLYAAVLLLPWLFLIGIYFDLKNFFYIFTHFALDSATLEYSHINAPVFWYIRWWFDTLRPGWSLFLALFAFDLLNKNIDWKKITILVYIFGGLIFFSLSANKIWWYVLPLIPAIAYYIYLSTSDYLARFKSGLINISAVMIIVSIPVFLEETNKMTILYGVIITASSLSLLFFRNFTPLLRVQKILLVFSMLFCLIVFYSHFPKIIPFHYNTKTVALYFSSLPDLKCLWIMDMPPEAALFYSNAGETPLLEQSSNLIPSCRNYLITPVDTQNINITYSFKNETFNLKDQPAVFKKGDMRLIRLH